MDIQLSYDLGEPFLINTFDVDQVRVLPIKGLENPYAMAFKDNGDILVTERYTGKLRLIRDGTLIEEEISGVPQVYTGEFRSGLMAVAFHPDDDQIIYLTHHKRIVVDGEDERVVVLIRARLIEDRLADVTEIFQAKGLDRGIAASKLIFTPDKKLLMSLGGAYMYAGYGEYAQDPSVHLGKLLRLNDDGTAVEDNPFIDSGEYLP